MTKENKRKIVLGFGSVAFIAIIAKLLSSKATEESSSKSKYARFIELEN